MQPPLRKVRPPARNEGALEQSYYALHSRRGRFATRPRSALRPRWPPLEKRAPNELAHVVGDGQPRVLRKRAKHAVLALREKHVESPFPFCGGHGVIMHTRDG